VTAPEFRADATLRVALGEYDSRWQDREESLDRAAVCVERAAANGARLVVLPEMCATGFTMEPEKYAEAIDGPTFARLSTIAAVNEVHLLAGVAMQEAVGYQNVAVMFNTAGSLVASYAKQRLFRHGGEHEHYVAGRTNEVIDVEGVRISPFICYDLRFPELFRAVAPWTDVIAVLANWPAVRRAHWDALLPARAIENLSYVIGVNRTGNGNGTAYDGGSAAYDPWGVRADKRTAVASPAIVDVSTAQVKEIRSKYPFLDDLVVHAEV
jgi:predicted amidohydrolase